MNRTYYLNEPLNVKWMMGKLLAQPAIQTGEWQTLNTAGSLPHATHELEDVTLCINKIPISPGHLRQMTNPDLPWAEDHFAERVSGLPHNPPPSAAKWPYAPTTYVDHIDFVGKFDHTYPERFWPKHAGHAAGLCDKDPNPATNFGCDFGDRHGIRFDYGDLSDVVRLLDRSPLTRQAYLPVWFPEDTGASSHKGKYDAHRDGDQSSIRVPCTLGYHFMIRSGELSCRYYIRSCDAYRHWHNDVYFAARLVQWMCVELNDLASKTSVIPGKLIMYISSFHVMVGDVPKLIERYDIRQPGSGIR